MESGPEIHCLFQRGTQNKPFQINLTGRGSVLVELNEAISDRFGERIR